MAMCQIGLMPNCNGQCKFCLIKENEFLTLSQIYEQIDKTIENIKFVSTQEDNWTTKFADGISLLGGEIFYLEDKTYKNKILDLIDVIIEYVLKKSPNPKVKFSTVTNGNYDPNWLLYPVIDKIVNTVGIEHVDVNFSYDFEFRFYNDAQEERVRKNINEFHNRYNYITGIQMILTQHLVDKINDGFDLGQWTEEKFPGNQLALLYPHPIYRGYSYNGNCKLQGFYFTRESFLKCLTILKHKNPTIYQAFKSSTEHSAVYKYTMMFNKTGRTDQVPILSDGKEIINESCNHSELYQCYSDTDKCMLCDLEAFD